MQVGQLCFQRLQRSHLLAFLRSSRAFLLTPRRASSLLWWMTGYFLEEPFCDGGGWLEEALGSGTALSLPFRDFPGLLPPGPAGRLASEEGFWLDEPGLEKARSFYSCSKENSHCDPQHLTNSI